MQGQLSTERMCRLFDELAYPSEERKQAHPVVVPFRVSP
jgi:hypothetical protein